MLLIILLIISVGLNIAFTIGIIKKRANEDIPLKEMRERFRIER